MGFGERYELVSLIFHMYFQISQEIESGEDHLIGHIYGFFEPQKTKIPGTHKIKIKIKQTVGSKYGEGSIEISEIETEGEDSHNLMNRLDRQCLIAAIRDYITRAVGVSGQGALIQIEGSKNVVMQNNRFVFQKRYICKAILDNSGGW